MKLTFVVILPMKVLNINSMKIQGKSIYEKLNDLNLEDYSTKTNGNFRRQIDKDITYDKIENTDWSAESNYHNSYYTPKLKKYTDEELETWENNITFPSFLSEDLDEFRAKNDKSIHEYNNKAALWEIKCNALLREKNKGRAFVEALTEEEKNEIWEKIFNNA